MAETAHAGPYGSPSSSGASAGGDGVKDQAQEKAAEVKDQAKEQVQQVAGQAKGRLSSQVDQRSTQAGQQVSQQASDLRSVGQQLREQGKEGPAKVADQVAERVEGVGNWLTNSDGDKLLHDIEDFGRRQPTAVLVGGLALGFLASRFLKASSSDRYERRGLGSARQGGSAYGGQPRTGYTNEVYGTPQLPEQASPTTGERFSRSGTSTDPSW
jgi:gas vesicle protein